MRDLLIGCAVSAGGWLVATAASAVSSLDLNPTTLTATGFVVWYAWHSTTKAIPQLVDAFRAECKELRDDNKQAREHEAANRAAFLAALGQRPGDAGQKEADDGAAAGE